MVKCVKYHIYASLELKFVLTRLQSFIHVSIVTTVALYYSGGKQKKMAKIGDTEKAVFL